MLDQTIVALGGTLSVLAFFGGIALLIWVEYRAKIKQRQIDHIERMKSLEAGLPLPDAEVARANAERARSRAAGLVGFLVPLVMVGGSLIGTLVLINYRYDETIRDLMLPLLCVMWGVCGLVSLVVPIVCASTLFRRADVVTLKPAVNRTYGQQQQQRATF